MASYVDDCLKSMSIKSAKELEVVKLRKKRRQLINKLNKQEEQLKNIVAGMKATEGELISNKSSYDQLQRELDEMGDDLPEIDRHGK
jgi:chromosome segregation ATPase